MRRREGSVQGGRGVERSAESNAISGKIPLKARQSLRLGAVKRAKLA